MTHVAASAADLAEPAPHIIQRVQHWLTQVVIGLNLCPFAKAVHVKQQIHYQICADDTEDALYATLQTALHDLATMNPEVRDTTLLILPTGWDDFERFNDFLWLADRAVQDGGLEGELQIASFHPQYQFDGTAQDDISNCTNRAPYPILHLLREASIERAVAAYPDPESIYGRNIQTLRNLGWAGWRALNQIESEKSHDSN